MHNHRSLRRQFVGLVLLIAGLAFSSVSSASGFPTRSIEGQLLPSWRLRKFDWH